MKKLFSILAIACVLIVTAQAQAYQQFQLGTGIYKYVTVTTATTTEDYALFATSGDTIPPNANLTTVHAPTYFTYISGSQLVNIAATKCIDTSKALTMDSTYTLPYIGATRFHYSKAYNYRQRNIVIDAAATLYDNLKEKFAHIYKIINPPKTVYQ